MTGRNIISARNAGLFFRNSRRGGRKWVLRHLNFDIAEGETLGVVGTNGAGKSTLLRLLCGIFEPDEGTIVRHDNHPSLLSLGVGFLPYLTGRQNAILSGILLGMRKRDIIEKLPDIIEFTGLSESIDDALHTYSTGMSARLGFGVAIEADPKLLVIDEILGVGDADFQVKSSERIQQRMQSNRTVVIATHSAETIRSLCDRAMWIHENSIEAMGDTASVMSEYEKYVYGLRSQRQRG